MKSAVAQTFVDLELVLALDASSSVSTAEFILQAGGIASAFRDPEVHGAIRAAGDNGVAVAITQWAGRQSQKLGVDFFLIRSAQDAQSFAARVESMPRVVAGGSTAVGNAISHAELLIERNNFVSRRSVVDISGDGRTNQGFVTDQIRDQAIGRGLTVNGLAILNEDRTLDRFYRDKVIGGFAAFVLTATDYRDFSRAIRLKLIREIGGPPLVENLEFEQFFALANRGLF